MYPIDTWIQTQCPPVMYCLFIMFIKYAHIAWWTGHTDYVNYETGIARNRRCLWCHPRIYFKAGYFHQSNIFYVIFQTGFNFRHTYHLEKIKWKLLIKLNCCQESSRWQRTETLSPSPAVWQVTMFTKHHAGILELETIRMYVLVKAPPWGMLLVYNPDIPRAHSARGRKDYKPQHLKWEVL